MIKFIDQCLICGSKNLKMKNGSLSVTNTKKKSVIKTPKIQYIECENCGETYTNAENEAKIITPSRKVSKVV